MRIDRRNDLSLRLLEVFGAVMERRTTTGAAEHLGISQPAVSNAVRALERQLGLVLFERTSSGLAPTEEARHLLRESEPIFRMLRMLEDEVRDLKHSRSGRLRIFATPPIGHTVAPHALRELLEGRERVKVRYTIRRMIEVVQAVEAGAADVGLFLGPVESATLDVHVLAEADLVAVMPRDHPLASRGTVTAADLARYPLIGLDTSIGAIVAASFAEAGVPHEPRIEARYSQTASALVSAGLGVAVIDSYTATSASGLAIVARRFSPHLTIQVMAVTRRGVAAPKLVSLFLDILRRRLEQAPLLRW